MQHHSHNHSETSWNSISQNAHELTLTVINENDPDAYQGSTYEYRCQLARSPYASNRAIGWTTIAVRAARAYTKRFGDPSDPIFSVAEILLCAAELEDYYREHIAESDRLDQVGLEG